MPTCKTKLLAMYNDAVRIEPEEVDVQLVYNERQWITT